MIFDLRKIFLAVLILALLAVLHERILTGMGSFLVQEDIPQYSDAAVVLYTGVDIYPRLIEAADLYKKSKTGKVVINGNRKTEIVRDLESSGYEAPCKWYAEDLNVLIHLNVPKEHIMAISAEDAFDTISEARIIGDTLINTGMKSVIITTSKFHSRRAHYIWSKMFKDRLDVYVAPARNDPFNPESWWRDSRQIRWVLSEYGAWVYYYYIKLFG
jgi:uncharacterized SAM-binding protein YcdF (DUF218 family)